MAFPYVKSTIYCMRIVIINNVLHRIIATVRATTDTFGEFKIDKLAPNSGKYEIEVTGSAGSCLKTFDLGDDSLYLGVMILAA